MTRGTAPSWCLAEQQVARKLLFPCPHALPPLPDLVGHRQVSLSCLKVTDIMTLPPRFLTCQRSDPFTDAASHCKVCASALSHSWRRSVSQASLLTHIRLCRLVTTCQTPPLPSSSPPPPPPPLLPMHPTPTPPPPLQTHCYHLHHHHHHTTFTSSITTATTVCVCVCVCVIHLGRLLVTQPVFPIKERPQSS
ncbi:hypothetical protein E2C01_089789 [Portunus trituberculatus]|uniref:Uncharacterized protein n=1 Tax=Portunus trituberculatus TaxID=210409 RepID=A0A5B7JEJ8_PORTR|nr:hypothetical protein [Portunus trituberculatus]